MTRAPKAPRVIRAVTDTTALLSYAQGHVHIGELMREIRVEGAMLGVPAAALLDAHTRLLEDPLGRGRLAVLAVTPGAAVLPLGADEALEVAPSMPDTGGDMARAHALWAAQEHDAYYLTCDPASILHLLDEDQVHQVPYGDA